MMAKRGKALPIQIGPFLCFTFMHAALVGLHSITRSMLQCPTPFCILVKGTWQTLPSYMPAPTTGWRYSTSLGTSPEWLPPRRVLRGVRVGAAWGEPGPPMRVLVIGDAKLLLSENGGRTWVPVGPEGVEAKIISIDYDAERHVLSALNHMEDLWVSLDGGVMWQIVPKKERPPTDPPQPYEALLPPGTIASVEIPGPGGKPATSVAGTTEGLQVSADGGMTWVRRRSRMRGV